MSQLQPNSSLLDLNSIHQINDPKIAIVCTEWNEKIVDELVLGAERILAFCNGLILKKIKVPGSFELPFACRKLWQHFENQPDKPEAIIAFGAIIRGGTPHFEYVSKAVTEGILQLNMTLPIPVIFGVLTLDNETQAYERLGDIHGHKGEEAGITAIKMIGICRNMPIQ